VNTCCRCGDDALIEGIMENRDELVFTMSDRKKSLSESPIAFACENCGHIQLMIDLETIAIRFRKESTSMFF